jgi:hypothetical protein
MERWKVGRPTSDFIAQTTVFSFRWIFAGTLLKADPIQVPGTDEWSLIASDGYSCRVPLAIPKQPAPESGYAVVYVFDANTNFPTWVDTVKFQKV